MSALKKVRMFLLSVILHLIPYVITLAKNGEQKHVTAAQKQMKKRDIRQWLLIIKEELYECNKNKFQEIQS